MVGEELEGEKPSAARRAPSIVLLILGHEARVSIKINYHVARLYLC